MKYLLILVSLFSVMTSCSTGDLTVVEKCNALINFQEGVKVKHLTLDYTSAIDSGFVIPSVTQTPGGFFKFSFSLKNPNTKPLKYYYKIFYQNESYKFPEIIDGDDYNKLSSENFYGSWENNSDSVKAIEVKQGESVTVVDSFRIVGNPRNEQLFFGTGVKKPISADEINELVKYIKTDAAWLGSISEKAIKEHRTLQGQLELDAVYTIREKMGKQMFNNRWKRNPRTGEYSFRLLVFPETEYSEIPDYIVHIEKRVENNFINPFYFLKEEADNKSIASIPFAEKIKVKAAPDPGTGIYINSYDFKDNNPDTSCFTNYCNSYFSIYNTATFEQFFHYLPDNLDAPNIPVVKDLQGDSLTLNDYRNYVSSYNKSSFLQHTNRGAKCPCETVLSDSINRKILIRNPAVKNNTFVKENTGIRTRHGFTYGKYTFKVKLPELLNRNNMWNGLTNAMWMINQINETWNYRRDCEGNGFIPKEITGEEHSPRSPGVAYSEIDFEIRKGSPVWPKTSYPKKFPRPAIYKDDPEDITVLCTNWDLACGSPEEFQAGAFPYRHNDRTWVLHRWNHWYQAISSKYSASDDELFKGDYYYFQIEWKPESITWRIGSEKNKLREICYMDSKATDIPNNQMLAVITQEYHISQWWPESPYLQEYIPFPEKDIIGEILQLEIE